MRGAESSDHAALLVGWTVIFSGVVSMGTLAHGFAGYLESLVPGLPPWAVVGGFLAALGAVNFWCIRLTSGFNVLCTGIELTGLLVVVAAGLAAVLGGPGGAGGPSAEAGVTTLMPADPQPMPATCSPCRKSSAHVRNPHLPGFPSLSLSPAGSRATFRSP